MRCNAGIKPSLLLDQHLIAEYRELLIPTGQMRKNNWKVSLYPSPKMPLGKGHITFWRDKQLYLKRRHEMLIHEMRKRGFAPKLQYWDVREIPEQFLNDWHPSERERNMLVERILDRIQEKPGWYRYRSEPFLEQFTIDEYEEELMKEIV